MTDIVYNKNGIEFDIDAIATDLNGKMDTDGTNAVCPTLLNRTANNQGGVVEIWSDGYCVQTGRWTGSLSATSNNDNSTTVTFSQAFKDNSYIVNIISNCPWVMLDIKQENNTTTAFTWYMHAYANTRTITQLMWRAEGYIR